MLYPTNFLDQEKLRDAAKNFDANADILIEVLMPRWTQSAVKIPGSDFASQRLTLKQAFDDVRLQVYQSSEAEVFKSAKETVRGSMERLQQAIKSTT